MGVEGSDVDGVPKEVGGVGRPRSGPIRIIAPRRRILPEGVIRRAIY
jgi:hypothetical protein